MMLVFVFIWDSGFLRQRYKFLIRNQSPNTVTPRVEKYLVRSQAPVSHKESYRMPKRSPVLDLNQIFNGEDEVGDIAQKQKQEKSSEAADIAILLQRNEALRVAFIHMEESGTTCGNITKEYYSKMVKADLNGKDQQYLDRKQPGRVFLEAKAHSGHLTSTQLRKKTIRFPLRQYQTESALMDLLGILRCSPWDGFYCDGIH